MPEEEVGRLTLAEFDALLKRKQAQDNRERLNTGIVAAMIYNCTPFGDPNREPRKATDFLPDDAPQKPAELDLTKLSAEQQRNYFMSIFMKRDLREKG